MSVAPAAGPVIPAAVPWLIGTGILVGLSRCYLAVDSPGDVLADWVLAVSAAVAAGWI